MRIAWLLSTLLFALSVIFSPAHAVDISASTWAASDASNNSAPPDGWPAATMLPSQVSPAARAMMGAIKRWWQRSGPALTSGGTANVQTLSYSVAPTAYVQGDTYTFIAGFTNTGAATLNVNSLGAKSIKVGAADVAASQIVAGRVAKVAYDGTNFQLLTDHSFTYDSARISLPNNRSITVAGTGTLQAGGSTGPVLYAQAGYEDTLNVQAQAGALPSTNTTNLQLYLPSGGTKAWLNITAQATLPNEERFLVGYDGSTYMLSSFQAAAGVARNICMSDGKGAETTMCFQPRSGGAGTYPKVQLGVQTAIVGGTAASGDQELIKLDSALAMVVGAGANITSVTTQQKLLVGNGGLVLGVATPSVAAGQVGLGTTTAAASNCGSLAGAAACLKINVGGTDRYIPYY